MALCIALAGLQGFEPQLSDPESDVLPLDDSPSSPEEYNGAAALMQGQEVACRARQRTAAKAAASQRHPNRYGAGAWQRLGLSCTHGMVMRTRQLGNLAPARAIRSQTYGPRQARIHLEMYLLRLFRSPATPITESVAKADLD